MDTDQYMFTLEDFSLTRGLKSCADEPPMAGHIRWLRRRLLDLLPPLTAKRDYCACCDRWNDLVEAEFVAQRERGYSPHAVFDLEPEEDDESGGGGSLCAWSECAFPSDTEAITVSTWSDHLLATNDPDPYLEWEDLPEGEPEPFAARFHQLVALIAGSELSKAIDVLIQSSVPDADFGTRLRGERQAGILIAGATELANRAERHLAVSPGARQTGSRLRPHDAEIVRHDAYFRVTFKGRSEVIPAVKNSREAMVGLDYIYHILGQPQFFPVEVYTLDCSYRNTLARHATAESDPAKAGAVQAALASGEFHETTQVGSDPNSKHLRKLEKLLEKANAAREKGDEEAVERLKREAQEVHDEIREQEEEDDRGAASAASDTPERAASRNVGKALKRAIEHVECHFGAFGKHLATSFNQKMSGSVIYSPREKITWLVRTASEDDPPS